MIAFDRLEQIIPQNIALANKALSVSLQQVSKLPGVQLRELAGATAPLRTCSDLPLVNALTVPVPPEAVSFFNSEIAKGSGPNGTLQIVDFFGSLAGVSGLNYIAIVNTISTMDVAKLQAIYNSMLSTVKGSYGSNPVNIPVGIPGTGTYPNINNAFVSSLIPLAKTEITNLIALYPSQTTLMNKKWKSSQSQVTSELELQKEAGIDWCELTPENKTAMLGWIRNLPNQGLDTRPGGTHWFIQSISDMSNLPGQSIIGCLRQGVNQFSMSKTGINSAIDIPIDITTVVSNSEETGSGGSAIQGPQ